MDVRRLLDWGPVGRVRRIHGLEHATIHLLTAQNPFARLIGRSTPSGFYLYGQVDTHMVAGAASEALARLQGGEAMLAVHPNCGTNLAVAGILAGFSSLLASTGRSRSPLSKLPRVLLAATAAAVVAQPLGRQVQQHITTSPNPGAMGISQITRQQRGNLTIHFVEIT